MFQQSLGQHCCKGYRCPMAAPIAAAIAADAVGVRPFQHQLVFDIVGRDRIPVHIALELRRVSRGQASAGGGGGNGDRPARIRCFLRGHADACAIVQMAADGDGLIVEQIHIVGGGALLVVLDDRRAGHGERGAVHIHTAAVFGGFVAADLAAAHFELAVVADIHTAAVFRIVGIRAADGAAVHDERAEIVHTHAAAIAAGFIAGDLAAAHVERGGIVHTHAAVSAVSGVRRIAADGASAHGECAFVHIHAAGAVFALRLVVGDRAAVQIKLAAGDLHAAALGRRVTRDLAAVHINRAAGDLHAAAVVCRVLSDAAAVQIKLAAVDLHTAAGAVKEVRDLARTAAIRQGQFATGRDLKHGHILGAALDRPAVQADGDGASDLNGMLDLNILTRFQIIVAAAQNIILIVN